MSMVLEEYYEEITQGYQHCDKVICHRCIGDKALSSYINRNGIMVDNLSNILTRNDIKKSDAYQSGFLDGTTPAYEAYMRLKKSLTASIG